MNSWIALIRGINVGGKNKLPMKDLAAIFTEEGALLVQTWIQSGNVVFQHPKKERTEIARVVRSKIQGRFGFAPEIFILTQQELRSAIENFPFPKDDPSKNHIYFLAEKPDSPDLKKLSAVKAPTEQFQWSDTVFYLHAPDGIGRSKLLPEVERALGVAATGRNLKTLVKLWEMG